MRLIDVIRGPSRPTQVQLRHRRRRAIALSVAAGLALLLGIVVGASSGGDGGDGLRAEGAGVGWYGHLRTLAGAGRSSLDFEQRAQESAAIDRALQRTPFVRLAGRRRPLVALTFDDGPGPFTDRLLDELQRLRVPATFFVVGYQLPEFAPQLQREVDLGMTIGDHTADHRDLAQLPARDQRA
jgi:peptidoglycan-N-acetylglucosamine deacetylase